MAQTCGCCTKKALYRVGSLGFCSDHRDQASAILQRYRNPKRGQDTPAAKRRVLSPEKDPHFKLRTGTAHNTQQHIEQYAKNMRMLPTKTEERLYYALVKQLEPTTARVYMQHIIGPYIADLFIPYARLVIEADGASHSGRKAYDKRRDEFLLKAGVNTLRFSNHDIWQNLTFVTKKIIESCQPLRPNLT